MLIDMFAALPILLFATNVLANHKTLQDSIWSLGNELDKTQLAQPAELSFVSDTMTDQVVKAGSAIELRCEVMGIPLPVIRWFLNGKPLEGVSESNIYEKMHNIGKPTIQNGIMVGKLRIPCASKQDRGKYKCVASNGHMTLEKSARISIAGQSDCKPEPEAPLIKLWTEARFENEGNSVQLICRSQSGAVIAWYNEDRQLVNNDPEFEVFPNGDLMIKNAEWKHMGTYTCVASNEVGEDRISTFFYPTALSEPSSDEAKLEEE